MKIVVTDAAAIMQNDLSYDIFSKLGNLDIYLSSTREELIERCADADAVITNKCIIDRDVLNALPALKYVGVSATGTNIVDIEACREKGIAVTNVPSYSTAAVAQMVFAHILEFSNNVGIYRDEVRDGRWSRSRDFCYISSPLEELDGKTLGIYGLGEIGSKVAEIGRVFGMEVIYTSRRKKDDRYSYVSVDELFSESDFLSLNAPLNEESRHIVNSRTLSLMKKSAVLINTARGGLVDEAALYQALKDGAIRGAGIEVMECEPPKPDNPLFKLDNCNITPHVAWGAVETRKRLLSAVYRNLEAFKNGEKLNRIV